MLIMDDNHWLVEWLAYHWTTVNLRYLIMAIDGRSRTSPVTILDRWAGRIDFELWNDEHFFPKIPERLRDLQAINERRQQVFLAACMRELKLNHHRASWVMFTDTDEFITVNPLVNASNDNINPLYRSRGRPDLGQRNSLLKWLDAERVESNTTCFSMGRYQFSPDETPYERVQNKVPSFLNGSDFLTLRWLRPAGDLVGPKNVVYLPSVPWEMVPRNRTHQHRVIPELCEEPGFEKNANNSLIQVYHYFGTLEQFQFRDDARNKGNTDRQWGRNTRFQRFMGSTKDLDDSLRPWLGCFVREVGETEAARLLEGVGKTEGWPPAAAHLDRYAFLPPADDYRPAAEADEKEQEKEKEKEEGDGGDDDGEGDDEGGGDDEEGEDGGEGDEEASEGDKDGVAEETEHGNEDDGGSDSGKGEGETEDHEGNETRHGKEKEGSQNDESSTVFYSVARPDRSGAIVGDMLIAHAYAFSQNLTYGGACDVDEAPERLEQAKALITTLGLDDVLKFSCPSDKAKPSFMSPRKYRAKKSSALSDSYLQHVRSQVHYPPERHGGAVIHMRRGDVSPCGKYANRYLPNSYYQEIIADFIPPGMNVTILSESESAESFDDFSNYTLWLDSDLPSAWRAMLTADFVVLSKSSFSFVPAMLNPTGTVLYAPFLLSPLPGWVTVPPAIQERARARVSDIVNTLCSEEEKKVALRRLSQ
jgi:hypothetical protein